MSLAWLHSRHLRRGALFALAIAGGLAALLVNAPAPVAAGTPVARVAAGVAVLASLLLLLQCVQSASSRRDGLLALLLLVFGTRLLDGLTGGGPVRSLVAFALGGAATAIWWESRGRAGLWTSAATAALAGAAAALSATGLALLLLPTLDIAVTRAMSAQRRVAAVVGIWLLGGLALLGMRALGCAIVVTRACPFCPGQGAWVLLVKLFSSQEGLLSSSPLLWLGLVGWLCCRGSERRFALAVGACWLVACILVWTFPFAQGGFEGLVPLLGIGLGLTLDALQQLTRRWPLLPVCAVSLAFVLWNILLMGQYRAGIVPRDDAVAFAEVAGDAARTVARRLGSPLTWPGNWIAARSYNVPLESFDRVVGLDLFGPIDRHQATLPVADVRMSALLLDGWGFPRLHSGRVVRRVAERASVIIPLACAEPLDLVIVAAGQGAQTLWVNDARVGGWVLDEAFRERRARVGARLWRCPMSTVTIESAASGEAWIDSLVLIRQVGNGQ